MASRSIRQEQGIDATSLQQLGEFDPIFEFALGCRLVLGVLQLSASTLLGMRIGDYLPLSRRQMSHCGHIKSIDQDLFLATVMGGAILAIGCTCISHSA